MSAIATSDFAFEAPADSLPSLRPFWLRPLAVVMVLATHIFVIGGILGFTLEKATPLDEIQVEVVPQGETVTETSTVATPESAPIVTPDQAMLAAPDPEMRDDPNISKPAEQMTVADAVPDLVAPPPKIESPDAPPIAVERPQPQKIEKTKLLDQPSEHPKKSKLKKAKRLAAMRALKRAEAEAHARQMASLAQLGAPAIHAGVRDGTGEVQRMSNSAYAALVSAEINRHKYYPSSARETGAMGTVGVVFTISASGAIVGHSITRSSGNSAIDETVHQMMAVAHPPPPPGGSFHGSVTINFNLGR